VLLLLELVDSKEFSTADYSQVVRFSEELIYLIG
jgi:hypothetical protein